MTWLVAIASFAAGILLERTLAGNRIRKAEILRSELRALTRNPVDLEPSEFSSGWAEKR
ncbi:hypothetical protein [Mesorhizobium sp.]|uniref:hypothetical protein n=1 Tax=Mesorhizobium sp. TaxID=1871066 RepID=UPI0025BF2BA2|nr:hypothetical protein [Mesorhizobium sp.]